MIIVLCQTPEIFSPTIDFGNSRGQYLDHIMLICMFSCIGCSYLEFSKGASFQSGLSTTSVPCKLIMPEVDVRDFFKDLSFSFVLLVVNDHCIVIILVLSL